MMPFRRSKLECQERQRDIEFACIHGKEGKTAGGFNAQEKANSFCRVNETHSATTFLAPTVGNLDQQAGHAEAMGAPADTCCQHAKAGLSIAYERRRHAAPASVGSECFVKREKLILFSFQWNVILPPHA